jgi:hypothetical protein
MADGCMAEGGIAVQLVIAVYSQVWWCVQSVTFCCVCLFHARKGWRFYVVSGADVVDAHGTLEALRDVMP